VPPKLCFEEAPFESWSVPGFRARSCMVRRALAALGLALVLTPSIASHSSKPRSLQLTSSHSFTLESSQWHLQYSAGVPDHPVPDKAGWSFDFPVYNQQSPTNCSEDKSCGHVNYITTPVNAAIAATALTMTFRIETTGAPIFQYALNPNNTCTNPAAVRLFIQRQGDTLEADHEFYRWWSKAAAELTAGTVTLTVPLIPDQWLSVFGKTGDVDQVTLAAFHDALQNVGNIGMTFGGGCFAGHGVNISGGTARFSLTRYRLI
jgi:hypothetical protein